MTGSPACGKLIVRHSTLLLDGGPLLSSPPVNKPLQPAGEPPAGTLESILDYLQAADLDGDGAVSLGDIFEVFGSRSFGPILLILGLIQALPTGGIPLMPDVVGTLTVLLFGQMMLKPERPWLPDRLMRLSIPQSMLDRSIARVRPWIRRADPFFRARLGFLMESHPALLVLAASGVVTGLMIIVLGFVPFAAAAPALALICLGIGLTAGDGLPLLLAYTFIIGSIGLAHYLFGLL